MKNKFMFLFAFVIFGGLFMAAHTDVSAQGRGNAGGAGRGNGSPNVNRPTNPNVDFGLGRASQRSNGRSDDGLNTAGQNSDGRSNDGINRARLTRENSQQAEREMQRNPNIAGLLRTNANDLRQGYQAALAANPDLRFGQFVAANMISRNLGSRNPSVTTAAILDGLANGDSMGQTLRNLGVSSGDAKTAERHAKKTLNRN